MSRDEPAKILVTTFSKRMDREIRDILAQIETIRGVSSVELIEGRVVVHGERSLDQE